MSLLPFARILVILGIMLLLAGGLIYLIARTDIPLGQLPGDIRIQRDNFTCLLPLVTSLLLSIFLTILLNIILQMLKR